MSNGLGPRGLLLGETYSWCNPELIQAHLAWYVSTILLFIVQSRVESGSTLVKQRMVRSAARIATITRQLRANGYLMPGHMHLNSVMGPLQRHYSFPLKRRELTSSVAILLHCVRGPDSGNEGMKEHATHSSSMHMNDRAIEQTEQNLTSFFDFLLDLISLYPFWRKFFSLSSGLV